MRTRYSIAIALGTLILLPGLAFAQATPTTATTPAISVILSYHEDNSGTFKVMADTTTEVPNVQDGDELSPGWTVVTGAGDVAELRLNYTGTIIKVSENTNFTIQGLRTASGGQDVFSLGVGKIRTVAGRASGKDHYQIRTQSAVCGVRGSDVVVEYLEATTSKLYTIEGTGWIQDVKTGQSLDVPAGDFADALAPTFQVSPTPADVLAGLQKDLDFVKLDPNDAKAQEQQNQQQQNEQSQEQPGQQNQAAPPAPAQNGFMDGILAALGNIFGLEIGAVTIGGQTYGKAILEPTFSFDKLKMAMYLPIIYKNNMLDPGEWYQPQGNNEWSFGTDQGGNPSLVAADITRDLVLKIKYIEYGRQRDPFFLKIGNLEDITIGHGLVMRDFANDADFPAVRRVGMDIGVDGGGGGFEAMVNDATPNVVNGTVYPPDILGARVYIRPVPGLRAALGFSTVVDLNPAKDFFDPATSSTGPAAAGNPIFLFPGVDLEIPFVETDVFGLVLFTDAAVFVPYFRSRPTDPAYASISQGFALNAVYDAPSTMPVKNWGAATGFFGNLIIPDLSWRLEYRYFTGTFQPDFYDAGYEQNRNQYVLNVLSYLLNPGSSTWNNSNMGIYGEGGLKLSKLFALRLGYFWPWTINSSTGAWGSDPNNPDHLIATFELEKGVIPVVNIWGSISYERSSLFAGGHLPSSFGDAFFGAGSVLIFQVSYPVSPIMDITLLYTTTPVFLTSGAGAGQLQYSNGNTLPDMTTTFSITTSIHL